MVSETYLCIILRLMISSKMKYFSVLRGTKSLNKIIIESSLESYLTRKFRSFHCMFKIWSSNYSRLFIHHSLSFFVLCLKWINKKMLNVSTFQWRITLALAKIKHKDPQSVKNTPFNSLNPGMLTTKVRIDFIVWLFK